MNIKKENNYKSFSLFDIEEEIDYDKRFGLNNSNIIRNISTDQSEIIHNILELYNNSLPIECDITASELKFYGNRRKQKYNIEVPKLLFDVYPKNDKIQKITPFNKIPLEDNSVSSLMCDLPFCISPKACKSMIEKDNDSSLIAKRFSSWYPAMEGYENMYWWMKECYRVLKDNGIVIWKMQNTVSGGINHWYTYFSFLAAQKIGFYVIDEFILEAKARLISASKIKKQCHARKFTSTFWVLTKDKKNANKTNCLDILDNCEYQYNNGLLEGKVYQLK